MQSVKAARIVAATACGTSSYRSRAMNRPRSAVKATLIGAPAGVRRGCGACYLTPRPQAKTILNTVQIYERTLLLDGGTVQLKNRRWTDAEFFEKRREVLSWWPTGKEVDLREAVEYHRALPD